MGRFAYDDEWRPTAGNDVEVEEQHDTRTRVEFFLREHPEATLVEITLRRKGHRSLSERLFDNPEEAAVENLKSIVLGAGSIGNDVRTGEMMIKRDDSYRKEF